MPEAEGSISKRGKKWIIRGVLSVGLSLGGLAVSYNVKNTSYLVNYVKDQETRPRGYIVPMLPPGYTPTTEDSTAFEAISEHIQIPLWPGSWMTFPKPDTLH